MPRVSTLVPLLLLLAMLLLAAPAAQSASPNIVVSQAYAGGGNAGAAFTHDFVELFNRGSSAVDVSGWTIQYASASGTSWQATPLSGTIQPGRYYLVQLASAAAVGAPLPTPDATGSTNLANSGGKIAVARDATLLTCGGAPGSCSANAQVADLIGWGSAADYEGTGAAAAMANTTANARAANGCTDTDDNAVDFVDETPAPRNASSQAASCGAPPPPPPPSSGASQNAAVDIDIGPVLSIALERAAISFGNAAVGDTPPRVSEQVTVVSNNAAGYALSIHRSAFAPADLPLGVAAAAPTGGTLGGSLGGGTMAAIPVPPTPDLLIGTTAAGSAVTGDIWPTHVGFVSPIPNVAPGRYTATVTFTVIGR